GTPSDRTVRRPVCWIFRDGVPTRTPSKARRSGTDLPPKRRRKDAAATGRGKTLRRGRRPATQGPKIYAAYRCCDRARALAASTSRFFGGAVVSSSRRSSAEIAATASTARWNVSSLAREGLLKPLIFRTYWSAEARISSSVAGGSKL